MHLTAHHGSAMQFPCFVPWFMGGLPFWEWVSLNLIRPSRLPLCPTVSSRMHKGLPSCACHARFFVSIELQDTGERFSLPLLVFDKFFTQHSNREVPALLYLVYTSCYCDPRAYYYPLACSFSCDRQQLHTLHKQRLVCLTTASNTRSAHAAPSPHARQSHTC